MAKTLLAKGGGGAGGILTITAPVGGIVTITKDGKTKTKTAGSSGTVVFKGIASGTWTVTLSDPTGVEADVTSTVVINADYSMTIAYFAATISVTYPEGSTCTCTKGDIVLTAPDTTGSHTFTVPEAGTYTVAATNGTDSASSTVNITSDGQTVNVNLSYQLYASDFDWTSYGTLNTDYQIVDDNDNDIPKSNWASTKNWKAKFLTTKSAGLKALKDGEIDVFCVGGGGSGGGGGGYTASNGSSISYDGGGGGGGYTTTSLKVQVTKNTLYSIVIGAGGSYPGSYKNGGSGGNSSAFGTNANGGEGSQIHSATRGGNGGSGGAPHTERNTTLYGGTDGGDGNTGAGAAGAGGAGQGTTTREFGETSGTLYSTGGNSRGTAAATANTGDGGGGSARGGGKGYSGGSGIVVIRNAR